MPNDPIFQQALLCRNVLANGRRTSIRLHAVIWEAVDEICRIERVPLNQLVSELDNRRGDLSLTEALRIYSISYFRQACRAEASPDPEPPRRQRFRSVIGRKIIRMMLAEERSSGRAAPSDMSAVPLNGA